MFKSLTIAWLSFTSLIDGCPNEARCKDCDKIYNYKIVNAGRLSKDVKESSGLIKVDSLFYTHGDSGTDPALYSFKLNPNKKNKKIEVVKHPITGVRNRDWEALAYDAGSFYIGDMGNNLNARRDLQIIGLSGQNQIESFQFHYKNQTQFESMRLKQMKYDSEAMVWLNNGLYLFSKSLTSKLIDIYYVEALANEQSLIPIDSLNLRKTVITGADINASKDELALLSYGKVLFFDIIHDHPTHPKFEVSGCKSLPRLGQSEAITYINDQQLLISNEKGKLFILSRVEK